MARAEHAGRRRINIAPSDERNARETELIHTEEDICTVQQHDLPRLMPRASVDSVVTSCGL